MTRRVHVLPDHVANQIAAGEVVERPASVVKELVENALDAGATRVRVEVEDGGKRLIRVLDNGCGMSPEDAEAALLRHATSKVATAEDLQSIGTLGFRGEALPSIRSVSRFRLRTRTHDAEEGVTIVADGADVPVITPSGGPPGTEIVVEDLFFNLPARRKFMRASATEVGRIGDLLDQLALSWPGVHFALAHNGRAVADYPAVSDPRARILSVLGREICRQLHPVRLVMGEMEVTGFASEPTLTRPNNGWVYTSINGRFIRDRVVQHAVSQAYGGMLDRGRFPVVVLALSMPAAAVDVNVHPTKAEVRFAESGAIHGFVERSVRLMLADTPWARPGEIVSAPTAMAREAPRPEDSLLPFERPALLEPPTAGSPEPRPEPGGFFSRLEYIGQVQRCFLVCQTPDELHLIDQHAAHERVTYERLRSRWTEGRVEAQRLLFPERIDLDATLARAAETHAEALRRMGFGCEPFGGQDWVVTEVPSLLQHREPVRVLIEVLAELSEVGTSREVEGRIEHILATMACHASVRAGDEMRPDEARALLKQMDGVPLRANCPHGRPVLVSTPFTEVARWFHRT